MIYTNFEEFKQYFKKNNRLIAIDFGTKKIGLSVSDRSLQIATPHSVIFYSSYKSIEQELAKIISESDPWGIIIGYPIEKDGKIGSNCHRVQAFARKLLEKFKLPIYFQDERETTSKAHSFLKALEIKRKKRDSIDDKIAASIILDEVIIKLNKVSD